MKKQLIKSSALFFLLLSLFLIIIKNFAVLAANMSLADVFEIILASCIATAFFYFACSRVLRKLDKSLD